MECGYWRYTATYGQIINDASFHHVGNKDKILTISSENFTDQLCITELWPRVSGVATPTAIIPIDIDIVELAQLEWNPDGSNFLTLYNDTLRVWTFRDSEGSWKDSIILQDLQIYHSHFTSDGQRVVVNVHGSIRILGTGLFFSWEQLHKIEGDTGVYRQIVPTYNNRILVMKEIFYDDGEFETLVVDTLELPSSSSPNMLSASQKLTKRVEL